MWPTTSSQESPFWYSRSPQPATWTTGPQGSLVWYGSDTQRATPIPVVSPRPSTSESQTVEKPLSLPPITLEQMGQAVERMRPIIQQAYATAPQERPWEGQPKRHQMLLLPPNLDRRPPLEHLQLTLFPQTPPDQQQQQPNRQWIILLVGGGLIASVVLFFLLRRR